MDAMNNRSKSSNLPPFYESIYAKLLADVNVPNDWIKNNKRLDMIHSHKYDEDKKDILATPVKKKQSGLLQRNHNIYRRTFLFINQLQFNYVR